MRVQEVILLKFPISHFLKSPYSGIADEGGRGDKPNADICLQGGGGVLKNINKGFLWVHKCG